MDPSPGNWLVIAEQVSREVNPAKLMGLIEQLCQALDDRKKAIEETYCSDQAEIR